MMMIMEKPTHFSAQVVNRAPMGLSNKLALHDDAFQELPHSIPLSYTHFALHTFTMAPVSVTPPSPPSDVDVDVPQGPRLTCIPAT